MEKGIKIEYYPRWLSKTGVMKIVKPVEFIGYKTLQNGHKRIYLHGGIKYVAEVWACVNEEGIRENCVFPVELPEEDDGNVGWPYNKNPIDDGPPNWHQDKFEFVNGEIVFVENNIENKLDNQIPILESIRDDNNASDKLRLLAHWKLVIITTPTIKAIQEWKSLKDSYKEEFDYLNQLLNL